MSQVRLQLSAILQKPCADFENSPAVIKEEKAEVRIGIRLVALGLIVLLRVTDVLG